MADDASDVLARYRRQRLAEIEERCQREMRALAVRMEECHYHYDRLWSISGRIIICAEDPCILPFRLDGYAPQREPMFPRAVAGPRRPWTRRLWDRLVALFAR